MRRNTYDQAKPGRLFAIWALVVLIPAKDREKMIDKKAKLATIVEYHVLRH
jgi:hypothetical protein